uniref:Uncharacterized protein n=1 Tax=Desertifilum tharense IPPAS B-1220 TaxID=1781255 RepID=A0ACD5H027_9CYAN
MKPNPYSKALPSASPTRKPSSKKRSLGRGTAFSDAKTLQADLHIRLPHPPNDEAAWVEALVRSQIIENWEAQDQPEHLTTIRDRLLIDRPKAVQRLALYRQILNQGKIPATDTPEAIELLMSGLVVKRDNYLQVNNPIYQLVFNEDWIETTLALIN